MQTFALVLLLKLKQFFYIRLRSVPTNVKKQADLAKASISKVERVLVVILSFKLENAPVGSINVIEISFRVVHKGTHFVAYYFFIN